MDIQQTIDTLGPWFHNVHLPDGTQTNPNSALGDFPSNKWKYLGEHLPADLRGWRALDIGCNAGFYTIELARRGAHVTAIDLDEHYLAQARWAVQQWNVQESVTFRTMQVYDLLQSDERFDLVLFMGVFYHLRYPMLGLDIVARAVGRTLVFQSLTIPGDEAIDTAAPVGIDSREPLRDQGWPRMAFIEHALADDPTNWWVPNMAAVEALLRSCGMRITARLPHELFICEPDPANPSAMTTWNAAEFRAATGLNKEEGTRKKQE